MTTQSPVQQPRTILRGHKAQVHAAVFVRGNERLATGDADGFVALWDLTIMRPRAVWRAHEEVILGIAGWGRDTIITHGRDHKLVVWKLGEGDESSLSTALPLDATSSEPRPQPWILHVLEVNTMNFCTFSLCTGSPTQPSTAPESASSPEEALVAVPNTLASEAIDIWHLPSQRREHTVRLGDKNGMVMALSLQYLQTVLTIVAGYENGAVVVTQLLDGEWTIRYTATAHSQPILSLDVAPSKEYFLTSSADAIIARHPLPLDITPSTQPNSESSPPPPPPSHTTKPDPEPTDTVPGEIAQEPTARKGGGGVSLLSAALASQSQQLPTASGTASSRSKKPEMLTGPIKTVSTKHAGQQGLRVRSDGRIFATAGWDARVRVYSCKTMKELAVLKWHQVGCYAIGFSAIDTENDSTTPAAANAAQGAGEEQSSKEASLVPRIVDVTVKERRISHAKAAHWLAAGAKDGKVSLWEVY